MVAWYWLIVAFFAGALIVGLLADEVDWSYWIVEIASIIFHPVLWLFLFPWTFWKNVIVPVPRERWEKVLENWKQDRRYRITDNLYLWHDKDTKNLHAKWFLVRIVDKEDPNKPSVPKGEFR